MTNLTITPELALALTAGIEKGIEELFKDGKTKIDPRDQATPDQKLEGLVLNVTVEVDSLAIGHDTDKTPTCSIPLLATLGLLVRRMGCTRDALTTDKKAAELLLAETGVAEAQDQVVAEVIAKLPRTRVKKSVKATGCRVTLTGAAQRAV
jgi:hypothetical protein